MTVFAQVRVYLNTTKMSDFMEDETARGLVGHHAHALGQVFNTQVHIGDDRKLPVTPGGHLRSPIPRGSSVGQSSFSDLLRIRYDVPGRSMARFPSPRTPFVRNAPQGSVAGSVQRGSHLLLFI